MSISGTLSNALSGLAATSRAAEVVSSNISNAMTEGYGRRELQLSAQTLSGTGGGVRVDGVLRTTDPGLITDRRAADASLAASSRMNDFYGAMERAIGLPGEDGSLNDRFARLESSLIEATSRPDSQPRLMTVLSEAKGLASRISQISTDIQSERERADRAIESSVEQLNIALERIAVLNRDIRTQTGTGRDASALMDQRQAAVDTVAALVPIKEMPRDLGEIALITVGGALLVDGKAARFEFSSVGLITPDMTIQSGALGRLTMNGQPVDTTRATHSMRGGDLDALFLVRDSAGVAAHAAIDGLARDLIERFESSSLDPTITGGAPGLFTDAGGALDLADESGLAGRLAVNAIVDPLAGGEIWRLRAGLYAPDPGETGDSRLLASMAEALQDERIPPTGGFLAARRSAAGLASDLLSRVAADRQVSEASVSQNAARQSALKSLELQQGVDTDQEMQTLLLVEQAYAANARIVRAVDEMLEQLLGI